MIYFENEKDMTAVFTAYLNNERNVTLNGEIWKGFKGKNRRNL